MWFISQITRIIKLLKDKNVALYKKMLFVIPIIYLIIPYDFIGDFFPVLGQIDDVAVFILMWPLLKRLLDRHSMKNQKQKEDIDKSDSINLNKDDYDID